MRPKHMHNINGEARPQQNREEWRDVMYALWSFAKIRQAFLCTKSPLRLSEQLDVVSYQLESSDPSHNVPENDRYFFQNRDADFL